MTNYCYDYHDYYYHYHYHYQVLLLLVVLSFVGPTPDASRTNRLLDGNWKSVLAASSPSTRQMTSVLHACLRSASKCMCAWTLKMLSR